MHFSTLSTKNGYNFYCLLKIVKNVIINKQDGEIMRLRVFKALANPALIFYVPYSLAVMNFTIQFLIFMTIFVASLIIKGADSEVTPAFFLVTVIIVHSLIAVFSKRDPQLGQIIAAKIQFLKTKAPRKLVA